MSGQLQLQVQQNTQAINQLIQNAKNLSQISLFEGILQPDDLMLIYLDASDESVAIKYSDFLLLIGGGNDKHYAHAQPTPATTWVVTHNLQKYPSVTVMDSANNHVEGDVLYNDINTVTLTFSAAFSGSAILN